MTNLSSESYAAFATPESTSRVAQFLEWLARSRALPARLKVVDVGCGPGRLFSVFHTLGWQAAAMEPDPDFHEAATDAAAAVGYPAPLRGGFLAMESEAAFDLVAAINDPFSHLLTGAERAEALRRVHRALRPGGVLLFDVPNFLWVLKNYRAPEPMRAQVPGGEVHLRREHVIDFHAATFTTLEHYELVHGAERHQSTKAHVYAMTTLPELTYLLEQAGFSGVETYGSWNARSAESIEGSRLILSAVRPT